MGMLSIDVRYMFHSIVCSQKDSKMYVCVRERFEIQYTYLHFYITYTYSYSTYFRREALHLIIKIMLPNNGVISK